MFQDLLRRLRALRGRWLAPAACASLLLIASCQQATTAFDTTCADIAAMPPAAVAVLDAQDPHSALGVIWADAKSACSNGIPVPGVSASWGSMLWGELKVLIPQLLPSLLPILIGLI